MTIAPERIDGVEGWMVAYLADLLDIPATEVDATRPFDQFGLDSAAIVAFTSDLGRWLGVKLDMRLMVEQETIRDVAGFLKRTYGKAA
ncbi:MAG: acyl carrier protein [Rubellimicrobium sp.]|nr:acyl carrier protein [Rubellimicrobium sp.]